MAKKYYHTLICNGPFERGVLFDSYKVVGGAAYGVALAENDERVALYEKAKADFPKLVTEISEEEFYKLSNTPRPNIDIGTTVQSSNPVERATGGKDLQNVVAGKVGLVSDGPTPEMLTKPPPSADPVDLKDAVTLAKVKPGEAGGQKPDASGGKK